MGLKYDQPLFSIIEDLKKVLQVSNIEYDIVNQFGQKIPLTYRMRTDVEVYIK